MRRHPRQRGNQMRLKLIGISVVFCTALAWGRISYTQAGAGFAAPVVVVQADPHHDGTLLAATSTAQLFRSRDRGDTWSSIEFPGALRSTLHAMLIDPTQANVYLVAVSSETPEYAGVFRSVDEGGSWQRLPGMGARQVWALAFWQADARVIAAGSQDGVFLTRDGGETWTHLSSPSSVGPQPVVSLAFDPGDSNTLYAGTPHLAWKTADSGSTWRRLTTGMQDDSDIFSIDVHANQRRRLFAGACSGIYSSLDGGVTWSSLERAVGGAFRTYVIARTPHRPDVMFAGTSRGLIQSQDGGATWRKLSAGAVRSIAFDPADPRRIFVATDQGVLRSDDSGLHFGVANEGIAKR
jgi:photosystem II stability/assembly factor-like uncharacterized protein